MSEKRFTRSWAVTTGESYEQFGKPFSYNALWQKPPKINFL